MELAFFFIAGVFFGMIASEVFKDEYDDDDKGDYLE